MYLQGSDPIPFWGSMTEASACSERPDDCYSGTPDAIDNNPKNGWSQLIYEISNDPRTAKSSDGFEFELPVSTDISILGK
jgi:hypothetical protein